jgi:hypothetical protein
MVLPGLSLSFATGRPLHDVILMTMDSGSNPKSLVKFVPMPKEVRMRPSK